MPNLAGFSRTTLEEWAIDARSRTLGLVSDLSDDQFSSVPLLRIINPFLWEIGHVAYFQEYWVLRHAGLKPPILPDADDWYDSAKVAHDIRWGLPLPSRNATVEYLEAVRDKVLDRIANSNLNERDVYFILLSIFHEDMHDEAFTITRQTLGYPAPSFSALQNLQDSEPHSAELPGGDVAVPASRYVIGSRLGDGFIFDNEKWAHEVDLRAFEIARAPITQSEFLGFVDDDGYSRREFWSDESWTWRERGGIVHPTYWRKNEVGGWQRRHFDRWTPLEPHHPVANISWFEAEAYCRWVRRRLPTEFEWEAAAGGIRSGAAANLDWIESGLCDVGNHASGDSAFGCRQMIGNVWEWTANDFLPYPGFVEDPYKEYSKPWFGTHKTLRGGAWSTRSRIIKPSYRNFYTPDRRDIWAGFRTCALEL
jgi:ergothioneine biosynthesis protein EgtB